MGYQQAILISSPLAPATRTQALQSAFARWPFLRTPHSAGDFTDRLLLALPEMTDYLFDNDADYEAVLDQHDLLESALPDWSAEFPAATFAYLEADCFGGTCLYGGFILENREILETVKPTKEGHVTLLRRVGLAIEDQFPPFRRGYFDSPTA